MISVADLDVRYQAKPVKVENPRWDPLSATSSALLGTLVDVSTGFWNVFAIPYKIAQAAKQDRRRSQNAAGAASLAAGKGIGEIGATLTKATLVDVPMALTEGLNQTPALYGGKVRNYGPVTDWKDGSTIAGKV